MKGPVNKFWPKEAVNTLIELYPTTLNSEIAKILQKKEMAIIAKAFKLGLKKPKEFIQFHAAKSQFKKGSTPANKGRKQSEYMTPEAISRTAKTRFSKGNEPHNTKYDGYERITIDGYVEVRISKGVFKLKHRIEWEKINGPIPYGYILISKDGDTQNTDPENWRLVNRSEHMDINSGPKNLTDTMVATYLSKDSRQTDNELKQEILIAHPDLIQAKRTELLLNRKLKQYGTK